MSDPHEGVSFVAVPSHDPLVRASCAVLELVREVYPLALSVARADLVSVAYTTMSFRLHFRSDAAGQLCAYVTDKGTRDPGNRTLLETAQLMDVGDRAKLLCDLWTFYIDRKQYLTKLSEAVEAEKQRTEGMW